MNNQSFINQKIKEFVKKFYLNKLLKGAIFFMIITLLIFILYAVLEYFSYFNSTIRSVLFYSYITLFAITFFFYIVIPLCKIMGLGKQLSQQQIADIIGKHFPEIDDKLLNVFQLENMIQSGDYKSYELISTAIDTKIETIKPFPFTKAIPFKKTAKYIKWAVIPILLFVLLFSTKSEIFTSSTQRIVNYQQYFEKPAPYHFEVTNASLKTFQNKEFTLHIKVTGQETPDAVFIAIGPKKYQLAKNSNIEFSYTFKNLQQNTDFYIYTEEVNSQPFTLEVLPKPITISFSMTLHYPAYLNKNDETIDNNGDAVVPDGTQITWAFYTKNTQQLAFILPNKINQITSSKDIYQTSLIARASFDYAIVNSNQYCVGKDTLKHAITIIPDQYPEIIVESQQDSVLDDRIYFKGNIKDDYGFTKTRFVYTKYDDKDNILETGKAIDIPINHQLNIQDFYYYFDASLLNLDPGYRVDYYFEVFDNDGVNGAKSAKTSAQTFRLKTEKEIDEELKSNNSQAKSELQSVIQESTDLLKEINKLEEQLTQTKELSWQDKKKLEDLMKQYNELKKQLDEMKQAQNEQNAIENKFKNLPENLIEKQKELQKRFDEVLSDEMKAMFEKLQKLMNEVGKKNEVQDAVKDMKTNAEDLNKSLDQQLELFKQLEFEKKYSDIIEKTKKLSADEKLLSTQTEQKEIDKNELMQKQQDIQNQFNNLKKELQELKQLNQNLEEPNKLTNTAELQQKIDDALQESKESLQKNNRGKASQKQQEASKGMEEMADKMEMNMLDNEEEELAEDMEALRHILDNLVQISFDQEDNMTLLTSLNPNSSRITDVLRSQHNIQANMKMVADSLDALARRQAAVKPFIQKEVSKINNYLESAITSANDRKLPQAISHQQFVMTSVNNLSLMLAESMKEMKQKQNECKNCKKKKSGNGSCNKPGGKGKTKSARELQQQLNRQMEALKRSLEQGQQPKPGGQNGQQSVSEQLARMAAQQEAIRKMMQDYQDELKSQNGIGDKGMDKLIKDMEQTEKDLVNRIINEQTINRQKNIETRLLESERADMEREQEEKRESNEGKDVLNPRPPKEWNMDGNTQKQMEMLKSVPPNLNYYYKEKINQYFYNIE